MLGLAVCFECAQSPLDVTVSSPGQALGLCSFCKMSSACLNVQRFNNNNKYLLIPSLFVWASHSGRSQLMGCLRNITFVFKADMNYLPCLHFFNKEDFSLPFLTGLSSNTGFSWNKSSWKKLNTKRARDLSFSVNCTLKWAEQRDVRSCFSEE